MKTPAPNFPTTARVVITGAGGGWERANWVAMPGDNLNHVDSAQWHDAQVVGETTSGGWGDRVNASVALAKLRADLAQTGTRIKVGIYGIRYTATVQEDCPLWDPRNERLRA